MVEGNNLLVGVNDLLVRGTDTLFLGNVLLVRGTDTERIVYE